MVFMTAVGLITTLINQHENTVLASAVFNSANEPERDEFDDCYYLVFMGAGMELRFSLRGQLKTMYFHGLDNSDVGIYAGELPWGLKFNFNKKKIRTILGNPHFTHMDPELDISVKNRENWDLYHFELYSLSIEYSLDSNEIKLITLMSADTATYRN